VNISAAIVCPPVQPISPAPGQLVMEIVYLILTFAPNFQFLFFSSYVKLLYQLHHDIIRLFFIFFFLRWQARREQDRSMRAGLIPSRALQERRIVEERKILMTSKAPEFEGRRSFCHSLVEQQQCSRPLSMSALNA
jgi:hypothetical protein